MGSSFSRHVPGAQKLLLVNFQSEINGPLVMCFCVPFDLTLQRRSGRSWEL